AEATQTTDLGPMTKTIRVTPSAVELTYRFEWREIPIGSLRLGDVTLQPSAFDRASLFYRTHNGGGLPGTFALHGTHDAPRRAGAATRARSSWRRAMRSASPMARSSSATRPARFESRSTRRQPRWSR